MSIEPIPELDIDRLAAELTNASDWPEVFASAMELEEGVPLVTVTAQIRPWSDEEFWDRVKSALLELRSSNVSAILRLRRSDVFLEDDDVNAVFAFLKDWDQFTLQNFLEMCEDWVPNTYQPLLQNEAKLEAKWFQEWLSAASDTRISKYPGLPWRSYVRKVVGENFAFATRFLELTANAATPENIKAVQSHFMDFLESKKKVLCMFPKHWNRGNA